LEVGVKQAVNSMETCLKQYNAANKSLEGAQLGYEIALKRYEIGSGTLLELQDSQLALLRSKLTLNQAIYSYMMAKSSLEKVLGTSLSKM
jgi:outer membrane protein TolC